MNEIEIKLNGKTNEKVQGQLSTFPDFALRCKLGQVLKQRGMKMQELSDLTGIRIATISEMVNMKRSTLNVPHLIVIAKALRITDVSELFEFIMPNNTRQQFEQDQQVIEGNGLLPEQDEYLTALRQQRKEQRKNPPTN